MGSFCERKKRMIHHTPHANLLRPFRREVQEEQWENSPQHLRLDTSLACRHDSVFVTLFPTSTSTDDGERNKGSTVNSISRVMYWVCREEKVKTSNSMTRRARLGHPFARERGAYKTGQKSGRLCRQCVRHFGHGYCKISLTTRASCCRDQNISMDVCLVRSTRKKQRHQTTRCRQTLKERERKV